MSEKAPKASELSSTETRLRTSLTSPPLRHDDAKWLGDTLHFVAILAQALMSNGTSAYRLEDALARLSRALGIEAQVLSMATSITLSLAQEGRDPRTIVMRVTSDGTHLERLSALYDVIGRVENGTITPRDGTREVQAILARPDRYGAVLTILCYGISGGAVACLLGAGLDEVIAALGLGLLVGVTTQLASRAANADRLVPALGALVASTLAFSLAAAGFHVQPLMLTLASVAVLLPGLAITTSIIELATGNLVSGTARAAAGAVTFLQMGFGIALGDALLGSFVIPTTDIDPLPEWTSYIASLFAALSFVVLLRARPRDVGYILAAAGTAILGAKIGNMLLGPTLAGFLGAFLAGVASHATARYRDRPVAVMLVPAILLLVPGSIGFHSLSSLLFSHDGAGAIETAFKMALVAMSLAAGILLATLVFPPRRAI